jgi:hypothetical protein
MRDKRKRYIPPKATAPAAPGWIGEDGYNLSVGASVETMSWKPGLFDEAQRGYALVALLNQSFPIADEVRVWAGGGAYYGSYTRDNAGLDSSLSSIGFIVEGGAGYRTSLRSEAGLFFDYHYGLSNTYQTELSDGSTATESLGTFTRPTFGIRGTGIWDSSLSYHGDVGLVMGGKIDSQGTHSLGGLILRAMFTWSF